MAKTNISVVWMPLKLTDILHVIEAVCIKRTRLHVLDHFMAG